MEVQEMFKRIASLVLCMVVVLAFSSCSWFETPKEPGMQLDSDDPTNTETTDNTDTTNGDTADTDEPGMPTITGDPDADLANMQKLGENLQFFHSTTDDCVIVYNHENAWAFDYKLNKVTKLTDFDAMYAAADVHGRADGYFDGVTLDVECEMNRTYEIRIMFTVTSKTADAFYKVYSHYTLEDNSMNKRGDVRGYHFEELKYPGSDEIVVIYDVEDFNLLVNSEYDSKESYLYRAVKALVEVDVPELEAVMNLKEGTLSEWESVVISDYSITNEKPLERWIDTLILTVNITESSVERYPAGTYTINIYDGPGPVFSPDLPVPDPSLFSEAEKFVNIWVSHCGGWFKMDKQTMANSAYAHHITDLYLGWEQGTVTLEGFEKFCKETFGYTLEGSGVTRESVEQHGGHGGTDSLCEITSTVSSGNNYVIEVTFYADQLKSVVSRIHRIHITDNLDGTFEITSCEAIYDTEYDTYDWGI